ncbi:protein translocase subunit [Martiniozyma asiatica (nom. inval.)]|nr:protein translocase subunit [Martiniozyma asiatica]
MSSFLGFGKSNESASAGAAAAAVNPVAEQIKQSIVTELSTAYATTLINSLTENCFDKCYQGRNFTSGDQCVEDCSAKFMRSWNLVSRSYIGRINEGGN